MIRLVIAMSLLATGKIRCQLVLPGTMNVQLVSPLLLDPRSLTVQGRLVTFTPQPFPRQNTVQRLDARDQFETRFSSDNDLDPRSLTLTDNQNQPERRIVIPQRAPDRVRTNHSPTQTNRGISRHNNTTVIDQERRINMTRDQDLPSTNISKSNDVTTDSPKVPVVKPGIDNGQSFNVSRVTNETGTSEKPFIVDKATGVEVTLDERANFDGDKCPTGTVRINDMCVEKDEDKN